MGKFGSFFVPSELPYPTGHTGRGIPACGNGPKPAKEPEGFLNKYLLPKYLPYPMPACGPVGAPVQPSPGGGYLSPGRVPGSGVREMPSMVPASASVECVPAAFVPAIAAAMASAASAAGGAAAPITAAPAAPAAVAPGTTVPVVVGPAVAASPAVPVVPVSAPLNAAPITAPSAPLTPASTGGSAFASAPVVASGSTPTNPAPVSPVTVVLALPPSLLAGLANVPVGTSIPVSDPAPIAPTTPVAGDGTGGTSADPGLAPGATGKGITGQDLLGEQRPAQSAGVGTSKVLRAHIFNPEFTPHFPTAQEAYVEDVLEEIITTRMISRDATPVAFVVPEGCDSMDLLFGPIEVNPGCGCDSDLEQIVTVGEAKLSANVFSVDGPLVPGEQLIVTVPWRAASWVSLQASRLRMTVFANFYKAA